MADDIKLKICGSYEVRQLLRGAAAEGDPITTVISIEGADYKQEKQRFRADKERIMAENERRYAQYRRNKHSFAELLEDHLVGTHNYAPRLRREFKGVSQHILVFVDAKEFEHVNHPYAPQERHVREIENIAEQHYEKNPDKTLLIHCGAGVSRSTAGAIAILVGWELTHQKTCDIEAIVTRVRKLAPRSADPNPLMINMIDKMHGLQGALVETIFNQDPDRRSYQKIHRDSQGNACIYLGM